MKSKLSRQQEEAHRETTLDIEAIIQERYQKNEALTGRVGGEDSVRRSVHDTPRTPAAAVKKTNVAPVRSAIQTKTARIAGHGATGRKRNVIRVSVDFPVNLYEAVVEASNEREQTIREFILSLVRQHFSE